MCLTTNVAKAKRADKNITVYKIFYRGINQKTGKEVLRSPYTNFFFFKDKRYIKAKFKITNHNSIWEYFEVILRYTFKREGYKARTKSLFFGYDYDIEDGFIHSCTTQEEAVKRIDNGGFMTELCEIYQCIIPKGSFFYKGVDELNDIASRKLKIIRKIY